MIVVKPNKVIKMRIFQPIILTLYNPAARGIFKGSIMAISKKGSAPCIAKINV